jgi:hypothetical protein
MMVISQKSSALVMHEPTIKNTSATPSAMLMTWRAAA